ncbi:EamA/RhaT family transporter [Corallococcus sp. AB011P]|uniref:DMT family transporter n=1 Tax=unclassified Corallococcus TaxID=2685029 RepID=UPI000EA22F17|nr:MULTISPECIES: DMT family transporter [unclassified Corallococcus]RKG56215.1 EamA/RhaT family transporter [Corallococcus sp. AB011P]RKH79231.1 EamA/RhaT family transporter [Corallococcus sp. AB045]
MRTRTAGFLLVALSGASFGALGLFARLAYAAGTDMPTLLFLRFTLAGLVLAGVMVAKGGRWPRGRVLGGLVLLGAVGYFTEGSAYFIALQHASAGLVALLLYLFPALVALIQVALGREHLSRSRWLAVGLALCGTALTVDPGPDAKPLGIGLGVLSAVIYALYVLSSARVVGPAGPLAASTVVPLSAGLAFGTLMLVKGPSFPQTPGGWAAVAGLTLLSTVVAMLTFFAGLKRIGPVNTSLLSTLEPVMAVVLGAIFLGERLSLRQGLGGLLILVAVVVLARGDPGRRPAEPGAAGA